MDNAACHRVYWRNYSLGEGWKGHFNDTGLYQVRTYILLVT
jgi:hypothetical protein